MVRLYSPGSIDREEVDELRRRVTTRATRISELVEKVVVPEMRKSRLDHEVDMLRFLMLDIAECDANDFCFLLRHGRTPRPREAFDNDWRTDDEVSAGAAS